MVAELIRAVNYYSGNCQKPIKLEILAAAFPVGVDPLTFTDPEGGRLNPLPAFKYPTKMK